MNTDFDTDEGYDDSGSKINTKSVVKRRIFNIKRYCKFLSVSFINPLSIKVKNVKKPIDNVIINNIIRYIFFLINSYILI